jgi:EF hand
MQFARSVMLALSLVALASAPAFGAGYSKSGSTSKNTSTSAASGSSSSGAKSDEFARMDKNHDGKISRQEWRDAHKASAAGGSSSKNTHK